MGVLDLTYCDIGDLLVLLELSTEDDADPENRTKIMQECQGNGETFSPDRTYFFWRYRVLINLCARKTGGKVYVR
jgi:hypothetical protein